MSPSLHSALGGKHEIGGTLVIPAGVALPLSFTGFVEGGPFAYLVRAGGHEVLFLDTANFIERELEGIHPDVASSLRACAARFTTTHVA